MSVWNRVTSSERSQGVNYYEHVNRKLTTLAIFNNTYIASVCGAFAALSPNNDEEGNFNDLRSMLTAIKLDQSYDSFNVSTYGPNKLKAWKILNHYADPLITLGGLKVTNFYLNLLNPSDREPVTIDGHMVSIWNGKRLSLVRRDDDSAIIRSPEHYNLIADDVRRVADKLELIPCQVQSTLWLTWKRIHRIRYDPQLKLDL